MKLRYILLLLMLVGVLMSCGGEPNTLFDEASPENSVMEIYVTEKDSTEWYILSNLALEKEILEALKNTTATPVQGSTKDVKYPVYSFSIGSGDGWGLNMTWSNGYLWNRDGLVYKFDFNFPKLLAQYPFDKKERRSDSRFMLNERYLVLDEDGWNASLLERVDEPVPPAGITLDAVYDGEKIEAVFHNSGRSEWSFGTYYALHVKLGDGWYSVPVMPDKNWGFPDIGYTVQPGKNWEETYNLEMYGELPAGHYRLYAFGLTWEFDVL